MKIDGIDSVTVSLNRGVVVIRLKPENRVTLERVREAIRANGFTPKEADVRAHGTVSDANGQLALSIAGTVAFRLAADTGVIEEVRRLRGEEVTIDGRVPVTARGTRSPAVLQVRGVLGAAPR